MKKKNILPILLLILVGIIGGTLAYYTSTSIFENVFQAGKYGTEAKEEFIPPTNWKPGDETPKTLTVKNTGDVCENVRVSYTEEWTSKNGDILTPEFATGKRVAIINLDNENDWKYDNGYYYYDSDLQPGESTNSFIKSVIFNPEYEGIMLCAENGNTKECKSSGEGYDGGQYELTLKAETVQCDQMKNLWGYEIKKTAEFDTGPVVNQKITSMIPNDYLYQCMEGYNYCILRGIKKADALKEDLEDFVIVSSSTSKKPIYMWIEKVSDLPMIPFLNLYYYTEADEIYLNEDSSMMFSYLSELNDIDGLQYLDTSRVKNMSGMFLRNYYLNNIEPLSSWDTSNVEDMSSMFESLSELQNINSISNWDNSKVVNTSRMFLNCSLLNDTFVIKGNPTHYDDMFKNAAVEGNLVVNYSRNTINIDDIIATKGDYSRVVKGNQID